MGSRRQRSGHTVLGRVEVYGGLLAIALIMAACGEGGDAEPAEEAAPATDGDAEPAEEAAPATDDALGSGSELDALYAAAQEEGALVMYSNLSNQESRLLLVEGFEAAYPGIAVEHTGKGGNEILEQFLTEKRAGRNDVDIFHYAGLAPFENEMQDEGFLEEYVPTEADLYDPELSAEGFAYPFFSYQIGAAYNPNLVTEEEIELLQSYEGWADPVFRDRCNITAPTGGSTSNSFFYWVEEDADLGEEWLGRIADQGCDVFNSTTAATERMAAGEYAVSFNMLSVSPLRLVGTGAPAHFTWQEYVVTTPNLSAIASESPNPNAARLFQEWVLSEQGQVVSQEATAGSSVREGFSVPLTDAEWWVPANEASTVVTVDEDEMATGLEAVVNIFIDRFGGLG